MRPLVNITASFVFFSLLLQVPTSAFSGSLAETAQDSIVYIFFDVTNSNTGEKAEAHGTGFVVTGDGYVLTAAHVFRDWLKQSKADRDKNLIKATLRNKPGLVPQAPFHLQLVDLGDPDQEDVALFKLPSPAAARYKTAPICLKPDQSVGTNEALTAFGFPLNGSFQPIPGTFGTQDAPGGRWYAASAFTEGMSGGPIYSSKGVVVGIVKGGIPGSDAVRWLTPIQYAENYLRKAGFTEDCSLKSWEPKTQDDSDRCTASAISENGAVGVGKAEFPDSAKNKAVSFCHSLSGQECSILSVSCR